MLKGERKERGRRSGGVTGGPMAHTTMSFTIILPPLCSPVVM